MKKTVFRWCLVACMVMVAVSVDADIPHMLMLENQVVQLSEPRIYNRVYPWVNFYLKFPRSTAQCLANAKATFEAERFVFTDERLPDFLVYNKAVESCGLPSVVSSVGAIGAWQIMPATGIRYGYSSRELYDPQKNADVAAKYHRFLYDRFNDWLLVFAAYNTGEGNVERAITRAQSRNFWDLSLLPETMDHVPKILALMAIDQSGILGDVPLVPGARMRFVYAPSFTLPSGAEKTVGARFGSSSRVTLRIKANYVTIDYLSQKGNVPMAELIRMNPHFNLVRFSDFTLPQKEIEVLVPSHMKEEFVATISHALGHALEVVP